MIWVPRSLLLCPDLSPSAKLIWMVSNLQTGTISPTWLCETSGLSRPTVLKALACLKASGWEPVGAEGSGVGHPAGAGLGVKPGAVAKPGAGTRPGPVTEAKVRVPESLLTNPRIGVSARILYGILPLTPGFHHPRGQFTYPELSGLTRASAHTLHGAVAELARAEWIMVERENRLATSYFELTTPGASQAMAALAAAERRLKRARYRGEALMREYLSLLIDSEDYEDDANPGFLENPRTGERLQLDRFYPPSVGFEHNGPQHYRATGLFTAEEAAAQRERDLIKLGICVTRGITLVIIHPEDLTLRVMRQKVANLLPLRDLTGYEPLIGYLEAQSLDYMGRTARL